MPCLKHRYVRRTAVDSCSPRRGTSTSRSFYNRGGVDAVAIFLHLARSRPDLELTIRAKLPDDLDPQLRRQIKGAANIHVIEDKLSTEAIAQLFAESDFYLLPAATLHSMSTIEAMAHGCICVLADAWGSDEYLKDGINGLRIPGRHGRHWEFRPEHGVIAERHADLEGVDHAFVARAVDAIGPMLSDPVSELSCPGQPALMSRNITT